MHHNETPNFKNSPLTPSGAVGRAKRVRPQDDTRIRAARRQAGYRVRCTPTWARCIVKEVQP
jgi:hypothetical protein